MLISYLARMPVYLGQKYDQIILIYSVLLNILVKLNSLSKMIDLEKLLVNKYSGLISKGSSVPGLPKNSAEAYSFEIWNKSRRIRVYCKNRHAYDKAFPLQIYYSDDDLDNAQNKRREVEEYL